MLNTGTAAPSPSPTSPSPSPSSTGSPWQSPLSMILSSSWQHSSLACSGESWSKNRKKMLQGSLNNMLKKVTRGIESTGSPQQIPLSPKCFPYTHFLLALVNYFLIACNLGLCLDIKDQTPEQNVV